jgi:hypothetical protein
MEGMIVMRWEHMADKRWSPRKIKQVAFLQIAVPQEHLEGSI